MGNCNNGSNFETVTVASLNNFRDCQEDVAEALENGDALLVEYCDREDNFDSTRVGHVVGYNKSSIYPYQIKRESGDVEGYSYVRPVVKPVMKTFVKSKEEILEILLKGGYIWKGVCIDPVSKGVGSPSFVEDMFDYCGKEEPAAWSWKPEWLEEKEVA